MTTIKVINSCAGHCQRLPADRRDCVFATLAVDEEQGKDVGCLILDDTPAVCNSSSGSRSATALAAAAAADGLGYRQSTLLYAHQLQAEEGPMLLQLLQQAFTRMPYLKQVLLVSDLDFDADIQQQQQQQTQAPMVPDTAATLFAKATGVGDAGPWLYECSRELALPPLQVKHARVEDHDDLLPIVAAAAAGPWPSLAALPQSCEPGQPFALTRLISSQDSQNLVLVAEDEGKLVGLLVATLQLDASLLIQAFDLGFCDAFMPPEVYEECEMAARHTAADKAAQRTAGDEGAPAVVEPTAEEVREELVPLLLATFAKRQQQKNRSSKGAAAAAPHNLAAITMLCMQPGYEERAVDFLPALFAEFPQQEYCALTLPHSAAQPQLAQHMTLLRPVPGSSFPQVVLLLHRASLALQMGADWEVRLAVPDDVVGLHGLLDGLSNATDLQEAFLHAVGPQGAVVAAVNGEMVAMLATSPCKADLLDSCSARFRLDQGLPAGSLNEVQQHAQVDACIINPVFSACAAALLAGSLKLLNKSYMHYLLKPGQPAPAEILAVMQQQRSRNSSASNAAGGAQQELGAAAGGALYSFAKGMAHAPRHAVNAQIIIAGASDTGLSCLEHLLLEPHIRFTHLTLLAPGGVRTDSIASQMTAARVSRMGLHANVTIVESHMVALDAQQQVLMLADGGQLPYDLLAVTTGLQDQLAHAVAGAFPEAAQFVLSAQQLMSSSITPELAAGLRSVLVYGADLQAFDVLSTLIGTGVDAGAITWVCPGAAQEAPSMHLLRRLALQLGLELPEPQQGRLLDLVPSADGTRAVAALQGLDAGDDGPLQQMEFDLLVGCGSLQPSAVEASCLAGAHIVWDGRLVVDAQLCSSNPSVMGAGPGAKFSRRYTLPEVRHEHYNSCELGVTLADSIIKHLLPAHNADASPLQHPSAANSTATPVRNPLRHQQHQQQDEPAGGLGPQQGAGQSTDQLPALQQAKVFGCRLPGGHVFLCGCTAAAAAGPVFAPPPGGCTLVSSSGNKGSVLAISLDAASTVHQVSVLGAAGSVGASTAAGVVRLAGLPFSYLAAGLELPDALAMQLAAIDQARGKEAAAAGWDSGLRDVRPAESVPAAAPAGLTASPDSPGVWLVERDLLAALQQPWARLLFHEDFINLRPQLLDQQTEAQGPQEQLQGAHEQQVQQLAVDFMRSCRAELGGYHVHGGAGDGVAGC